MISRAISLYFQKIIIILSKTQKKRFPYKTKNKTKEHEM